MKERATFTVNQHLLQDFRSYCEEHHYKMSQLIEKLLKEHLQKYHQKKKHTGVL